MKSFIVEKKYILFPISMDAPCKMVTVCSEGEKIFEFDIPVENGNSPYRFQYYAPLNVEKWKGQEMTIEVEDALDFLEAVGFSDDRVNTVQHKPQIHFSPESGWINDPNGLIYANDRYHLFSSTIHFRISGEIYAGDMLSAGICCTGSSWIRLCSLMRMDLCFPGVAL